MFGKKYESLMNNFTSTTILNDVMLDINELKKIIKV